jgi:hypothetical protein
MVPVKHVNLILIQNGIKPVMLKYVLKMTVTTPRLVQENF